MNAAITMMGIITAEIMAVEADTAETSNGKSNTCRENGRCFIKLQIFVYPIHHLEFLPLFVIMKKTRT